MQRKVIPLCRTVFYFDEDWSIANKDVYKSLLSDKDLVLLLCKKYPNNQVKYIPVYRDLYSKEYFGLESLFEEHLKELKEAGYQVIKESEVVYEPTYSFEGEMAQYAFVAHLSKGQDKYFFAVSHGTFTFAKVEDGDDDYIEAIEDLHLHSDELYPFDYQSKVKGLSVYKGAMYLKESSNPYYYLYYVDRNNFDGHILDIHPNCKVICSNVADHYSIIKSINFPKGLLRIDDHAFTECSEIEAVIIPEGVKSIGEDAFGDCEELLTIELPASLKELNDNCFGDPICIETFIFNGTVEQWNSIKKAEYWISGDYNFDVECKDGSVHYSNKIRYQRYDEKDKVVTPELVDAQIKEMIALDLGDRLKVITDLAANLKHYLFYKRDREDKSLDFFIGLFRLFNDVQSGGFTKKQFKAFLMMLGYSERNLPFKKFEERVLKKSYAYLKYDAFDIITCGLPRIKRLNAVLIGCALFCDKKLNEAELKLVNDIMGPYKQ